MKYLKFALLVALVGCASTIPNPYPRYTELSKQILIYTPEKENIIDVLDSIEVNLRFMLRDTLDDYFFNLNSLGAGESVYSSGPDGAFLQNGEEGEWSKSQQRLTAIRKFLLDNKIVNEGEFALLKPSLQGLGVATTSMDSKYFNFVTTPHNWVKSEREKNPFNIQEFGNEVRVGGAVTTGGSTATSIGGIAFGKGSSSSTYYEGSRKSLTGEMGLDIFEIAIKNN